MNEQEHLENEHIHSHTHEHDHNGQTHSHEHTHQHVHEHGEHIHQHDHVHDDHVHHHHSHKEANGSKEEAVALLAYMVAHNEHHTEELNELAENMRTLGLEDAAEDIEGSVSDFKEGNLKLRSALALLQNK